jgi:hypothetical protein
MTTINTAEIRFCPECFGRLYLVIAEPLRWAHASNDAVKCDAE